MKIFFIEEFGKAFVPERVRPYLKKYLLKAGISGEPFSFFGILFYVSLIATLAIWGFFVLPWISSQKDYMEQTEYILKVFGYTFISWLLISLIIIFLIVIFVYFYLDIRIFNRTRNLEEILPDFLSMVSSNLKGGVSFEKALWMSIKPRFGILASEVAIAAKKVMTGHDIDVALNEFADKYDSPMLKRSMSLIIGEIASGGKISDIIDDIARNLKKTRLLKEEMSASVITYMIFIAAVVIVISPILYALSFNLLTIIQQVTNMLADSMSNSSNAMFKVTAVDLDKNVFKIFSHICIGVVAFFSSMIVSIIEKGNIKGGIKYIPMFLILSQIVYIIAFSVMTNVFSAMISF
jgi:pilus assembly protein TadC